MNAIPIQCGEAVTGCTDFATADAPIPGLISPGDICGFDPYLTVPIAIAEPGIWYSFSGIGQMVRLSTCPAGGGDADYDSVISVFRADPDCGNVTCVGGDIINSSVCGGVGNVQSSFTFMSDIGVEYLILVHGYTDATLAPKTGSFELHVEVPFSGNCPAPATAL